MYVFLFKKVDEIDSGELLVRFMKAVGEGLYVWPEKDDKAFVPLYDVIKTLKPPSLVARGRYQFGERKHTKVKVNNFFLLVKSLGLYILFICG